jgi:DNA-binding NarL/FixJ family response regulator
VTLIEDSRRHRTVPRVLIVDDHAFIRRGVQTILHAFPEWEFCGEAENGKEAIRLADELKPEVIIMDVSMPGLNGIEATRAIRKAQPGVKIVLLTLHESGELLRSAFRAGARGYLLKTDAEQELVKALTVVVGEGAYISPKMDSEVVKSVIREMSGPQ